MSVEAYPLSWPDGWVRTRPQSRRGNNTWKKTFGVYRDEMISELERLGANTLTLSTNVPLNLRGLPLEGYNPPDPGVAVYFTRTQKQDFSWQDVFELPGAPTLEQVESRFRALSLKHHPDLGGDVEVYRLLLYNRQAARDYFSGKQHAGHQYSLACDLFREVRLNLHSIGLTVQAMRQIERCGASSMLERAFRGFVAALPAHVGEGAA